jgi:hypothetical protein
MARLFGKSSWNKPRACDEVCLVLALLCSRQWEIQELVRITTDSSAWASETCFTQNATHHKPSGVYIATNIAILRPVVEEEVLVLRRSAVIQQKGTHVTSVKHTVGGLHRETNQKTK